MKLSKKKTTKTKPVPSSVPINGTHKWIKEYRDRMCIDPNELEQQSREVLSRSDFKVKNNFENEQNGDNDEDENGWTVVSRTLKKTRQRMLPSTEKTLNRLRAKEKRASERKELTNFYKFQLTEKKIDQLEQLKSKFELDKQKILQMRQQRKFKPF